KALTIGTGFSTPIPADPMPALRDWAPPEDGVLRKLDMQLLDAAREAFERIDAHNRAPSRVADFFLADTNLLCSWPEIDPFGRRREPEYVGPQDDASRGASAAWRTEARPRIFAYLKPRDPRFLPILEALRGVAGEAIVAAPGLSLDEAVKLSSPTIRVRAEAL